MRLRVNKWADRGPAAQEPAPHDARERRSVHTLAALLCAAALGVLAACVWGLSSAPEAHAGDRITMRGNYYREASTRVLAPSITFRKELPDERLGLEVDYLLDAISSASIGAGAEVLGGDVVFTELRHETAARVSSKIDDWAFGGFFRYSTETDYRARAFGVSVARELWKRNVTVSANYSVSLDSVFRIVPGTSDEDRRRPWTSTGDTNLLKVHYLGLGWSQTLHKTVLAGIGLEGIYASGPQDNPYRRVVNADNERHPLTRRRIAPNLYVKWAIPKANMVIEPRYRFYADDWGIRANAIDTRVHFRFADVWRLRLRYRFYKQSGADFWRPDNMYTMDDPFRTADPKMTAFLSHTPGVQLRWELDKLAKLRGMGWTRDGWIEATYNHVIQTNRFGNARLGSLAFSLAF